MAANPEKQTAVGLHYLTGRYVCDFKKWIVFTLILIRGGYWGWVQGVRTPPPPPEMTRGFLIQLVSCKKNTMWFIGVEVEQETTAPPPKKNPGSTHVYSHGDNIQSLYRFTKYSPVIDHPRCEDFVFAYRRRSFTRIELHGISSGNSSRQIYL